LTAIQPSQLTTKKQLLVDTEPSVVIIYCNTHGMH